MTILPTPQPLAELDDAQLERLAVGWRAQAARGDRRAFGMAHALEVERRRRLRESQPAQLERSALRRTPARWSSGGSPADPR